MGTAESIATPPNPHEYEYWAMGPAMFFHADRIAKEQGLPLPSRFLKRWYEIHEPIEEKYGAPGFRLLENGEAYWQWMQGLQCPVYTHRYEPEIPNSIEFPADAIRDTFGPHFGGSASWITGHAMYEHLHGDRIEKMDFPGVHLSTEEEYEDEARGLCFLMGVATGLGIKIECYEILLPIRNYGY